MPHDSWAILFRYRTGYQARPTVKGISKQALDNYFYGSHRETLGSTVLAERDEAGTVCRNVFGDGAISGLRRIREVDWLSPEQAAHSLTRPDEVFGHSVDLSDFSNCRPSLSLTNRNILRSSYAPERKTSSARWCADIAQQFSRSSLSHSLVWRSQRASRSR